MVQLKLLYILHSVLGVSIYFCQIKIEWTTQVFTLVLLYAVRQYLNISSRGHIGSDMIILWRYLFGHTRDVKKKKCDCS